MTKLSLYCDDPSCQEKAQALAKRLQLDLCDVLPAEALTVVVDRSGLGLKLPGFDAVRAEFSKTLQDRVRTEGRQLPLAKAVGLQKLPRPNVIDATGGLGRDAFLLAALGCKVALIERHPILHAMLEAALTIDPQLGSKITLYQGEASEWMSKLAAEVIYLDPMFPLRRKSALVKKEMQALKMLLGEEQDNGEELLTAALATMIPRVVLKRPAHAPKLLASRITFSVESKTHRFDVYIRVPR